MNIIDCGENDPLEFVLSDTDKAIADACKHAIVDQRYQLNVRDRQRARALHERERAGKAAP